MRRYLSVAFKHADWMFSNTPDIIERYRTVRAQPVYSMLEGTS